MRTPNLLMHTVEQQIFACRIFSRILQKSGDLRIYPARKIFHYNVAAMFNMPSKNWAFTCLWPKFMNFPCCENVLFYSIHSNHAYGLSLPLGTGSTWIGARTFWCKPVNSRINYSLPNWRGLALNNSSNTFIKISMIIVHTVLKSAFFMRVWCPCNGKLHSS